MSETINYLPNLNALDPKQQYINKPYVFNEEEKT